LSSTNSWILFGVLFVIGLLLLGISSAILRSLREVPPSPKVSWPQLIDDSLTKADVQLRLDMIERLSIIDSEWSREVLERARQEDPDEGVRSAVDLALQH
jgi:hypothetical protein